MNKWMKLNSFEKDAVRFLRASPGASQEELADFLAKIYMRPVSIAALRVTLVKLRQLNILTWVKGRFRETCRVILPVES